MGQERVSRLDKGKIQITMSTTSTLDAHTSRKELLEVRAQAAGGSETFYRHPLISSARYIYTNGVNMHMDTGNCYWLLDVLLSNISITLSPKQREYSIIEVVVPHHDNVVASAGKDACRFKSYTDEEGRWRLEDVIMKDKECDGIPYTMNNLPEAIVTFRSDYYRENPPANTLQANQVIAMASHPPGRWKFMVKSGAVPMKGATDFGDDWPNMALGYTLMLPNED